tara:strand:+ start:3006 stop:3344 length:339 start_codon:yes stop_codon:yes gene_type:complete
VKKLFLIICLFIACSCSEEKLPEGVLDKDKMTEVLMEIHLLEAKIQKLYLPLDSGQVVFKHYETKLLQDLGVSQEVYDRSLIYYVDHSQEMGEIYDRIVDSLMLKQNTLKKP